MVETFSTAGGRFCSDDTYDADHVAGLFKMAVNDTSERYLGPITVHLQSHGNIGLNNTGGVNKVRVNGYFSRVFDNVCKKKPNMWREYSISSHRR